MFYIGKEIEKIDEKLEKRNAFWFSAHSLRHVLYD